MVRIINVEPYDEDNKGFLKDSIGKRPIVAAFHMPGCMYCEMLKEPWNEFTKMLEEKYSGDKTIVAFVHKDVQYDVVPSVKGNLFIQGYPTIVGIKKGGSFEEFKGERSSKSLLKFYKETCGNKKIKKNRTIKGGSIGSISTAKNLDDALKKQEKINKKNKEKIKRITNIFEFVPHERPHGIPSGVLVNLTRNTLKRNYDIPEEVVVNNDISPVSSLGSQGHESTKPKTKPKTKRKRKFSKSSGGKRKNKHKKTKKSKK